MKESPAYPKLQGGIEWLPLQGGGALGSKAEPEASGHVSAQVN